MKVLFMVRGLSGSGKSTLAKQVGKTFGVEPREADDYFVRKGQHRHGEYVFQPEFLPNAHNTCQKLVERDLASGGIAVVSNTSCRMQDVKPYFEICQRTGSNLIILEPNTVWKYDLEECFKMNEHNVPMASLEKQLLALQANRLKQGFYNISPTEKWDSFIERVSEHG